METLRIAFIADRVEPFYHGGYERHVMSLAERLSRQHDVTVFTCTPSPQPGFSGRAKIRRIGPGLTYTRRSGSHSLLQAGAFALSGFLTLPSQRDFDFVDVLGIPYVQLPLLRLRALMEKWAWGITIWEAWQNYSFHAGRVAGLSRAGFRSILKVSVFGDHPVIVGSTRTRESLERGFGVSPHRIFVVPPGIDFSTAAGRQGSVREVDCAFVGRLDPFKRVDSLILATQFLKSTGRKLRVEIAGVGPEYERLRQLTNDLDLAGQVTFLGYISDEKKLQLLRSSKLFVMPSEREGFSIATLEAIQAGACPIVAQPRSRELFGAFDLVANQVDDVTYPVGDHRALASVISRLLFDEVHRSELAGEIERVARQFDLDEVARRYLSMVRSVGRTRGSDP